MKYLRIHTLLWVIICIIALLFNITFYIISFILVFIWNFRVTSWGDFNRCDSGISNYWDGSIYVDNTPMDTFKRYFYMFD